MAGSRKLITAVFVGALIATLSQGIEAQTKSVDWPSVNKEPCMSTGGTDMKPLRARGQQCYGIGAELPKEDLLTHAMHSDNERLKEKALYDFVKYEYEVVEMIAAKK